MIDAFKEAAKRELKFVDANTYRLTDGWKKVGDLSVMEVQSTGVGQNKNLRIFQIYNFGDSTVTQYNYVDLADKTQETSRHFFSQMDNKIGIATAHRALIELGGTPPPLEEFLTPAKKENAPQPIQLLHPVKIKKTNEQKPH